MKKMRNKGKVHPFTSSSSSSASNNTSSTPNVKGEALCVLNLLPAAVFTLLSVLSVEDREVLAYMITRSLTSSMFPAAVEEEDKKKKKKKKKKQLCCSDGHGHKSPALFDCECFHCYTSFWFRWDSSPNRELIHQAIEAFEDHLNNNNNNNNNGGGGGGGGGDPFFNNTTTAAAVNIGKSKRKDKMGRRKNDKVSSDGGGDGGGVIEVPAIESPENQESLVVLPEGDQVSTTVVESESEVAEGAPAVVVRSHHKGLARKVLPDVIGIFNSRLWSLWSPNV